jgi:hypothetical protein
MGVAFLIRSQIPGETLLFRIFDPSRLCFPEVSLYLKITVCDSTLRYPKYGAVWQILGRVIRSHHSPQTKLRKRKVVLMRRAAQQTTLQPHAIYGAMLPGA